MTTSDDGSVEGQGDPGRGRFDRRVLAAQAELITEATGGTVQFAGWPDDREPWDQDPLGIGYAYRAGEVLARERDVDRVIAASDGVLTRAERTEDGVPVNVDGVQVLRSTEPVPQVLARLDSVFGPGTATPHHVSFICALALMCPASEPQVTQAREPWPRRTLPSGAGVRVVVVDTGVPQQCLDSPYLPGVVVEPEDVEDVDRVGVVPFSVGPDGFIDPYAGHGAFIAGVVLANASQATVQVLRLTVDLSGPLGGAGPSSTTFDAGIVPELSLATQLSRALTKNPHVISLSAGMACRGDIPPVGLAGIGARIAAAKGVVLVAAAGNEGSPRPFWPAAYPWTVGVGALGADLSSRAWFSNHGGWVDTFAPGTDLVSVYPADTKYRYTEPPLRGTAAGPFDGGLARWSGTSFAAPYVAAAIATRISTTGEPTDVAVAAVLAQAQAAAVPGVGPRVL